ncbi:lipoprotein, putative [Magnetococcus marinus MC-1]|uniref:Lipoprotein, putative n=1 Tax=Magnetococcus marinus (strain ATCC BAA-1437 / JCM 17883 / MC-1) TaxID=156889 RepID=A0LD89_MAGMM|nr:lytic transglycosylase [Magnetococcus marinus]ABK45932.1 lipoprotein, putative [Magnetococcus marinus MC-1]
MVSPGWCRTKSAVVALGVLLLGGCSGVSPATLESACALFDHRSSWNRALEQTERRWGLPVHVQLAIIHQESKFRSDARPPRERLLWLIPLGRASSAQGYAQALDSTWAWYQEKTGRHGAKRSNFADAVDFIGWYARMSQQRLNISMWDARNQYLAYHEGHGGFERGSHKQKKWLLKVADKVANRSYLYRQQLKSCRP